ncbi:MAG: hypothetical protein HPY44_01930 [Armatimonadetes bacterium]|nr:hypothetical protein [Armatimonadota bacterium]
MNKSRDADRRARQDSELEEKADRLLVDSLKTLGRGEYPFYSRSYLRRLATADERSLVDDEGEHPSQQMPGAGIIWRIARKAELSPLETDLLRLAATGHTTADSARVLGITPARARNGLRRAVVKLQAHAADVELPVDSQIGAVWVEEQNRRGRVTESHCRPGQELCRKTGLCQRRWYLREG